MHNDPVKIGMKPPHPGDFIRTEILEALDLSIARAAEILDVRRATLSDLVNGKASLSPEMALRIEKAFGVSMDTLLRMQAWYDSYTMREHASEIHVKRYEPA
jgi:addiction module HigA family antidote